MTTTNHRTNHRTDHRTDQGVGQDLVRRPIS